MHTIHSTLLLPPINSYALYYYIDTPMASSTCCFQRRLTTSHNSRAIEKQHGANACHILARFPFFSELVRKIQRLDLQIPWSKGRKTPMPWLQVPVTDISHRTPGTYLIINSRCPLFSARCRGLAWFSDPWRSYKLLRCDLPVLSIARKKWETIARKKWETYALPVLVWVVSPLKTSFAYLSQCVLWCASFRNRSKKRGRAGLQQHQE